MGRIINIITTSMNMDIYKRWTYIKDEYINEKIIIKFDTINFFI